jgi:hypothetical protein
MKKILIVVFVFICIKSVFSQENETPAFIVELNTGYAIGMELPDVVPIEIKLVYPYTRFGFTIESGILLGENIGFHLFLGPTIFIINNPRMRVPVSFGLNFNVINKNTFYGIGGIVSFNYAIHRNIFIGANLSINYNLAILMKK